MDKQKIKFREKAFLKKYEKEIDFIIWRFFFSGDYDKLAEERKIKFNEMRKELLRILK